MFSARALTRWNSPTGSHRLLPLLPEVRERRAVFGIRLRALDERMTCELFADRLPEHARASPVHDTHLTQAGKGCFVDEPPRFEPRLVRGAASHVDLIGDVAARGGPYLHDGRALLRRPLA